MRNRGRAARCAAGATALVWCWSMGVPALSAAEAEAVRDLPYGDDGDPRQRLDIYLPPGSAPQGGVPAVVYVHGGGWVSGDKSAEGAQLARFLAARGYATVTAGYRLAPQVQHPAQAQDVAAAFAWVARNGARYGIDTGSLFLAGGSAGAHLAALVALDPALLAATGIAARRHLKGVLLMSGIYDLAGFVEPGMNPSRVALAFGSDPALLAQASPIAHLDARDAHRPPLFVSVTDHDLFGLEEQAMRFYSLLLRRDWPVELFAVPDRAHYNQFAFGERTVPLDERFVPEQLQAQLKRALPASVDDLLGPALVRFMDSVRRGDFVARFARAWPPGWPTGGFNEDYTMSLPLPEVPHEVRADLPYSEAGTDDPLRMLDLYLPAGDAAPRPMVCYLHGGGFRAGDKAMVAGLRERVLSQGAILISVNYRLSPAVVFPVHVQDVAQALAWVYRNAAAFGGDPERLGLMGISAGAHLAALTALDGRYLEAHGLGPGILRGVLAISGIYDLEWFREPGVMPSRLAQAFGGAPALLRSGSPQRHARAGAPPFVLTFTDRDLFLIREGTQRFADALQAAGTPAEVVELLGRDHFNQQIGIGRHIGFHEDMLGPVIARFMAEAGLVGAP